MLNKTNNCNDFQREQNIAKGSLLKNVRGEHNCIIFTSDIGPSFYRYFSDKTNFMSHNINYLIGFCL